MRELERRRIIEFLGLAFDRRDDRIAVMTGIGAPQPGGAVEHGAALRRVIVHVLGAGDEPRRAFEGAVGRERYPERFEVVGDRRRGNACLSHRALRRHARLYARHPRLYYQNGRRGWGGEARPRRVARVFSFFNPPPW